MASSVKLFGEWKEYLAALNPDLFTTRFDKAMLTGLQRIGMDFVALAKDMIVKREYTANAPAVAARKKSSTPLIDQGDLIGSIAFTIDTLRSVVVGANKKTIAGVNIAATLHEGTKDGKIPPRPFIQQPIDDDRTEESVTTHAHEAMVKALGGAA